MKIAALLMLAVLPLSAGQAAEAPEAVPETSESAASPQAVRPLRVCQTGFTEILREHSDGITQPQFRIINNVGDWCRFWEDVYSDRSPGPPCDTTSIDFRTDVAVVAAVGDRSNTCYDVRIACVNRRGDSIDVIVVETVPGFSCGCGDAITQPLDVVKVSRPVSTAAFDLRTSVLRCP